MTDYELGRDRPRIVTVTMTRNNWAYILASVVVQLKDDHGDMEWNAESRKHFEEVHQKLLPVLLTAVDQTDEKVRELVEEIKSMFGMPDPELFGLARRLVNVGPPEYDVNCPRCNAPIHVMKGEGNE